MTRSLRFIVPLIAALALASCGGEEEPAERASATTDATSLLRATFANLAKMQSATVDLKLRIEPRGAAATQGPVAARLHGPFVSQGPNKLPKFAFSAELQAAGRTVSGAAVWTGSKGYVTLQGTPYEISDLVMRQFVAGYEQSLQSRQGAQGGLVLGSLGIDFTKWLKNPRNEGVTTVGDAETVKISGAADVQQVITDLDKLTERASSLPGASGKVPKKLTAKRKQQAQDAIKALDVTVYTGTGDKLLRRLTVSADLKGAKADAAVLFDVTFTKVGQEQQIGAPANPRPFSELLKALEAAGIANFGVGVGDQQALPPTSPNHVDRYAACIRRANGDRAKGQKCAPLLSG